MAHPTAAPIARQLEVEALEAAVRWPNPTPQTIVALAGQLLATRRDLDGYAYFRERAEVCPSQPLFLALEGTFQARLVGRQPLLRRPAWVRDALAKLDRAVAQAPGLATYFRGLVEAELPRRFGRAEAAVTDLEWVLANRERFPVGLLRGAYHGLARAYAALGRHTASRAALEHAGHASLDDDGPQFVTDYWLTQADGFHFGSPRLVELAPGVHVAQGYDFGDFAFVLTSDGVVAIDTGTTPDHARAALDDLRQRTQAPITHVILTHAHWDHIGGLEAFRGADTRVIAQAGFADELRIVNQTGLRFRTFFGPAGKCCHEVVPDQLVREPTRLTIGGVEFGLHPASGGETADALLVHLPAAGVVFTGDAFMPYLGAPFLPEGSAEGLLATIRDLRELEPRLLIHGHTPLGAAFSAEALPGLEAALRDLHAHVLDGIRQARTVVELLHDNYLPELLREHPAAVNGYLILRDNVIQRLHRQRTGYWQPDGEGIEVVAPAEWAAALDLLAGGRENGFVRGAATLAERGDTVLALRIAELGLLRYPRSARLRHLRRRALDRLRERYQQLNPFKFIVYSELAGAELHPVG